MCRDSPGSRRTQLDYKRLIDKCQSARSEDGEKGGWFRPIRKASDYWDTWRFLTSCNHPVTVFSAQKHVFKLNNGAWMVEILLPTICPLTVSLSLGPSLFRSSLWSAEGGEKTRNTDSASASVYDTLTRSGANQNTHNCVVFHTQKTACWARPRWDDWTPARAADLWTLKKGLSKARKVHRGFITHRGRCCNSGKSSARPFLSSTATTVNKKKKKKKTGCRCETMF